MRDPKTDQPGDADMTASKEERLRKVAETLDPEAWDFTPRWDRPADWREAAMILRTAPSLSKAAEIEALYAEEIGRLRHLLETSHAKMRVAEDTMRTCGMWENSSGNITDAALWLDRAMSEIRQALSLGLDDEGNGASNANLGGDGFMAATESGEGH